MGWGPPWLPEQYFYSGFKFLFKRSKSFFLNGRQSDA